MKSHVIPTHSPSRLHVSYKLKNTANILMKFVAVLDKNIKV